MAKITDVQNTSLLFAEGSAPSTPPSGFGRIYVKTTGLFFIGDDGVEIGPLSAAGGAVPDLVGNRVTRTAGDVAITGSTNFTDVTSMSITVTTGARRVLIGCAVSGYVNNTAGTMAVDIDLDGSRLGQSTGGLITVGQAVASEGLDLSFTYLTDVLSAASHTFKLQGKVFNAAHTLTINAADPGCVLWVAEQLIDS